MTTHGIRITAAALLLGLASICGPVRPAGASDSSASPSDVSVSDAWARATPAGARMGAIYLTLVSAGGDRLLKASVPHSVAADTQIHETIVVADSSSGDTQGRMTMRPVESVELPAGEPVQLKPGGFHIMLLDLRKPLKAGTRVKVTLAFEHAGSRTVVATVREE